MDEDDFDEMKSNTNSIGVINKQLSASKAPYTTGLTSSLHTSQPETPFLLKDSQTPFSSQQFQSSEHDKFAIELEQIQE